MNDRRRFLQVLGGSIVLIGCGGGTGNGAAGSGGEGGLGGSAGAGGAAGGPPTGGAAGTTGCEPGAFQQGSISDKCHTHRGKFDVGTVDDYASDGLHKSKNAQSNVLIGRDAGGLWAMSSLCTHQCCDMNSNLSGSLTTSGGQPAIRCNCHGSVFRADGSVAKGPAYTALGHFALTLECDGHLYVDTEQSVDASTRLAV